MRPEAHPLPVVQALEDTARAGQLTDEQLKHLQQLLRWNDGYCLPDDRMLGRGRKGGLVHAID